MTKLTRQQAQRQFRQRLARIHEAACSPLVPLTEAIACTDCGGPFTPDGIETQCAGCRSPQAPLKEGLFNTIADPDVPEATRLRRVNMYLSKIGTSYHQGVPVQEIINNLKQNGFEAVQEDGTPWEGIVLGKDASWQMDLVDMHTGKPSRRSLKIQHHKMEVSGRYEVTAYVN